MFKSFVKPYGCLAVVAGGGCPQIENAIGIIKAIYAHDFCRFDEMWGTSAGALVSAVNMSLDQNIGQFEELIKTSDMSKWFKIKPWQAVKSIFGYSNYIADNTGLKDFLLEHITPEAVARVKCAVTEMPDGHVGRSIMCDGQPRHVLASMSFQHVFPPVRWGGMLHGDGGVMNNCPLPKLSEISSYDRIYIILPPELPLMPRIKGWKLADRIMNLIDSTMNRETAQIREFGIGELPNVVLFQPQSFVPSVGFLKWSDRFEQIDASYNYALDVLESREG